MADPASERKLAAKRMNERVKLGASFLNTLGLAVIGAALVVPAFSPTGHADLRLSIGGLLVGIGLHFVAQWLYRFLRSEE